MSNYRDFTERVKDFSDDQQALLQHCIDILIDIVATPNLPAVLIHAKVLSEDSAVVIAHCLSRDGEEADAMLRSFLQARAVAQADAESINEPRH